MTNPPPPYGTPPPGGPSAYGTPAHGIGPTTFGAPPPDGGPPPGVAPAPRGKRRGPKLMIVAGILMTVLGWGAFIGGFVFTGFKVFDDVEAGLDPAGELDVVVDVPGEGTVELDAGERYQVVVLGSGLTVSSGNSSDAGGLDVDRTGFAEPAVTVTGPDGEEVPLEAPSHDRLVDGPTDAVGIKELTAPTDGTYTLTVSGDGGAVSQVGIGEAEDLFEDVADYVVATIVIAVGGVVGSIGIFVLVGGFIWFALAR